MLPLGRVLDTPALNHTLTLNLTYTLTRTLTHTLAHTQTLTANLQLYHLKLFLYNK